MMLDKRMNRAIVELRNVSVPNAVGNGRKLRKLIFIGVGLAGMSAVGIALLWPKPANAAGIEELRQALRSVPACHSISSHGDETWQEGQKRRYVIPNLIDRSFDGKYVWNYQIQMGTLEKSAEAPDGFGMSFGLVDDIADDFARSNQPRPKVKGVYVVKNGAKRWVALLEWTTSENGVSVRAEFDCDPVSKLPKTLQFMTRKVGMSWSKGNRIDFDYPSDIPDGLFTLRPKPGVRVIDLTVSKGAQTPIASNERKPFPLNSGLKFGVFYLNRTQQGGMFKGRRDRAFSASAFKFYPNGTVDFWLKLGPVTNVYYLGGRQLELAGHAWKSKKDIPLEWPGTILDLMPGDWMQVRKGANAFLDENYVLVSPDSGHTKYTDLVHQPSSSPRLEFGARRLTLTSSSNGESFEHVASTSGDLPKAND